MIFYNISKNANSRKFKVGDNEIPIVCVCMCDSEKMKHFEEKFKNNQVKKIICTVTEEPCLQ